MQVYICMGIHSKTPSNPSLFRFQRRIKRRGRGQEAGFQPCQLWAKEVLSKGVHLRGGGPGAVSWHHAAAQRDDGQISHSDGSVAGLRKTEGDERL